jgi:hypothetical protein
MEGELQGACEIVAMGIGILILIAAVAFHGLWFFVPLNALVNSFRKKPSEAEGETNSDEEPIRSVAATWIVMLIIFTLLITLCLWREIS